MHQHRTLGDTVNFWFAANDTGGSGSDGTSATYNVRKAGDAAQWPPLLSGSAVLLSHEDYPAGAYEVAIQATADNGFEAGATYGVFCTLAVDGQNPTGFIGSFSLACIPASVPTPPDWILWLRSLPAVRIDAVGGMVDVPPVPPYTNLTFLPVGFANGMPSWQSGFLFLTWSADSARWEIGGGAGVMAYKEGSIAGQYTANPPFLATPTATLDEEDDALRVPTLASAAAAIVAKLPSKPYLAGTDNADADVNEDLYTAQIQFTRDQAHGRDEYEVLWFRNGVQLGAGIADARLQVVKRADGADLVPLSALSAVGSTAGWKLDVTAAAQRLTLGEAALAIATATIDGATRTWPRWIGRDK